MSNVESRIITKRLINAWLSSVISISLVLLLVAVASLLLVNAGRITDYLKENMKVCVLMNQDVTEVQAQAFEKQLSTRRFVKTTDFISREQGMMEMEDLLGEDFMDVFSTTPIPISIELTVPSDYVSVDSLDVIKAEICKSALVEDVTYQKNIVDALNSNLKKLSMVIGVFIVLMLFVSYVLISNTVRLHIYSRRFTIHTMKMVGATRAFIRAPFMVQSIFEGLFSAMMAILALIGLLFFVKGNIPPFFEIFSLDLLLVVIGIVIVSGVLICMLSTFRAVNKLVGLGRGEIYY